MTPHMTPNQVVSWNLTRARALREWTQEEAAKRLELYLGSRWSKAVYSAAERAWTGGRVRHFTADELYAFARGFELPMTFFLIPRHVEEAIGYRGAPGGESTGAEVLDLIFTLDEPTRQRLFETLDALPLKQELRIMRRFAETTRAAVAELEERLQEALEAAEDERLSRAGEIGEDR